MILLQSSIQAFFDKGILLVCGITFIVSILVFILLSSQVKGFLKDKMRLFLYVFFFLLLFAITPVIGYRNIRYALDFFIILQGIFLVLGIIHTITIYRYFDWTSHKNFFPELGFTFFVILVGIAPFLVSLKYLREDGLHFHMLGVGLCFLIPFFVFQTFEYAIAIPLAKRKAWFFVEDKEMKLPKFLHDSAITLLSIRCYKKENGGKTESFVIRGHQNMIFGQLFDFFIYDYNEKNPTEKIHIKNKKNKIYGWVFYVRPSLFSFIRYIDPEKTLEQNKLRNNAIIVALRYEIKE